MGTTGRAKTDQLNNNTKPSRGLVASDYYIAFLISYFLGQALGGDEALGAQLVLECCF